MTKRFHSNTPVRVPSGTKGIAFATHTDRSKAYGHTDYKGFDGTPDSDGVLSVEVILGLGDQNMAGDDDDGGLADRPNTPPTRVQGGADGERVDDNLDAGVLSLNSNLFTNALAGQTALTSQLIAGILDITKTSVRGSTDERSTAMVQATAAQAQVTHGLADTTGHSGHRPLSEEGSGSLKTPPSGDVGDTLKQVAELIEAARLAVANR